jgi:nucleotide-binding universal stress UspA family protein
MKILLATDGSSFSRKAVEKCCEFVNFGEQSEIKIISTVERISPMAAEPFAISADYYIQVEDHLRKAAKEAVSEAEKMIAEKCAGKNVSVSSEVFTGNVKQSIVDEAKKFGADLIIVGSHGYGFFDRMLLGSVSDFVAHHAPCSVLIVRPENGGKQE